MNITQTRKAIRTPDEFDTRELHEALDLLVNDERFSEAQVEKGQAAIEAVLAERKANGGRTYKPGTDIRDIICFDRGRKVTFQCSEHPDCKYMSKDPFCSNWFPANEATQAAEFNPCLMHELCTHTLRSGTWLTSYEYLNDETNRF